MAKNVTKYTVFLGSPSDLEEERIAVEEVITELNLTFGSKQDIIIELLKWETHSAPGISTTHIQDLIFDDIGDKYDIFLGLLWNRFGTPTNNAGSGTEAEFKSALERFQADSNSLQILFYFKDAVPKSMKEINPTELIEIDEFKKSIPQDKLLYWEFDTCENLKNYLRLHIPKRINTLIANPNIENTTIEIVENIQPESDFGLFDYSEMFESFIQDSNISLIRISESTEWIGEEITNKSDEIARISKLPNPNKNILTNIFKRTAKLLNDYSSRLEIETPIFYSSFEEAIKAGSNFINLTDDFINDNTIQELEETKESILSLRVSIPGALTGMTSFYDSVHSLPRIQKDINIAKRKLLIQLEDLIDKLNKTLSLTEAFSDEIGSKIDKLKIGFDE